MKQWIFSVYYKDSRRSVVGTAGVTLVESALRDLPDEVRDEIRASAITRELVEGKLNSSSRGRYYNSDAENSTWTVCIGPVDEVLP